MSACGGLLLLDPCLRRDDEEAATFFYWIPASAEMTKKLKRPSDQMFNL